MCKAAKNQFYDESKLQNWVNDKLFEKPPEKFDSQELEQVTVKGLSQDVIAQYQDAAQGLSQDVIAQQQDVAQGLAQDQSREQGNRGGQGEEAMSTKKESKKSDYIDVSLDLSPGIGPLSGPLLLAELALFGGACVYNAGVAANKLYKKVFNKGSETPDRQEPQQGAAQGLAQEQQRGGELGREESRAAAPDDRGQSMQEVRDQARELGGSMRDQGISSPDRSLGSVGESYVGAEAARRTHTASSSSRSR